MKRKFKTIFNQCYSFNLKIKGNSYIILKKVRVKFVKTVLQKVHKTILTSFKKKNVFINNLKKNKPFIISNDLFKI